MLPIFDMMMQAQNGNAIAAMSRQFGLAQEQVAQAMAALSPAFSTGFKRSASNPFDFSQLMGSMMTGDYSQYFEDLAKAFTPQGLSDGNSLLGRIFGSKDVSRAIAAQAAHMSGVGQEILKQMLPVLATAVMGGLMKQGMGQMPDVGSFFKAPAQVNMFEQWMQAAGFQPKLKKHAESLFDNPFMQGFQAMFAKASEKTSDSANPFAHNPFMEMFGSMTPTWMSGAAEKSTAKTAEDKTPLPDAGFADLIGTMFDSGLEVQKNYQKSIDSIFDTYMSSMKPGSSKADS